MIVARPTRSRECVPPLGVDGAGASALDARARPTRLDVKLVIQIPCLNERDSLPRTIADLPREIDGVDEIEVLVVDDGSDDGTAEVAAAQGVHHIVRFPAHRGLAAAFSAGLDASLRLGANLIVNTDADNQYRGADIPRLVAPILEGRADVVIGDRRVDAIAHFSPLKRRLQRWGSWVVRTASGTQVADATSGFRAMSRAAASRLFVHNDFSYTLETIIHGGRSGLVFADVPLESTNAPERSSRLFSSVPDYLRRNGPVIARAFVTVRPMQTLATLAAIAFVAGAILVARFFWFYARNPTQSGHTQSLVVGVGALLFATIVGLMAMLSELVATNRRLLEELVDRSRRLDADRAQRARDAGATIEGVVSTGAAPWRGHKS
jgi:glycosyltransferase involved in cell wall biosynthesis